MSRTPARRPGTGVRRVCLLGQLGIGNVGNEASLAVALRMLGADGRAEAFVACDAPDVVVADHGVPAVPLHHPGAPRGGLRGLAGKAYDAAWAWRTVRASDAVVVPGTGILEGLGVQAGGILLTLVWYATAARALRRPFVVLSVGVDRHGGRGVRLLRRVVLRSATYLSVRDDGSADAVAAHGLPRPRVVPDLVLGEAPARASGGPGTPADGGAAPRTGRPTVAVGVIDYRGFGAAQDEAARAAYVARTVRLVQRLVEGGATVRVIHGALPDVPTAEKVVHDALAAGCPPGTVAGMPATDLDGLDDRLAGCDVVVATRYHNLVAALRAGIPAVSVGYSHKQRWLLEQLGSGGRAHDVVDFDPDVVADQVHELLADTAAERAAVAASLVQVRAALAAQEREVRAALGLAALGLVAQRPGAPVPDRDAQEVPA